MRRHVTSDEVELVYDGETYLTLTAPGIGRPMLIQVHPARLGRFLEQLDSGEWLTDNKDALRKVLLYRDVYLDGDAYEDYRQGVTEPNGVYVRLDTRVYPEDFLHEMTKDRAISINVAARPFEAKHRTHIAEVRTQLSEHQHRLAYRLVDHLCGEIRTGRLALSASALLPLENKTPDEIEEMLT